MKQKIKIFVIASFIVSALLGWWRAGVKAANVVPAADNWQQLAADNHISPDFAKLTSVIKASGIFPPALLKPGQREGAGQAGGRVSKGGKPIPAFPKIISATKIDKRMGVILRLEDDSIITVVKGDVLEKGWEITAVDFDRIIAVFDSHEEEFPIILYDRLAGQDDLDGVDNQD